MYRLNAGMFWDKTEGMESHCGRRGDDKDEDTNKHRHLGTVYELQIHLIPSLTLTLPALKEQPCLITSLHTHTHTATHTQTRFRILYCRHAERPKQKKQLETQRIKICLFCDWSPVDRKGMINGLLTATHLSDGIHCNSTRRTHTCPHTVRKNVHAISCM